MIILKDVREALREADNLLENSTADGRDILVRAIIVKAINDLQDYEVEENKEE